MLPRPTPFEPNPVRIRQVESTADAPRARPGHPVLFDEEKRLAYCKLVRHGFTKGKAARLLGVAPRTVQETAQGNAEFAADVRDAILEFHAQSAAHVVRAGQKNWRAAAWLLDRAKLRRGPGRSRTRSVLLADPVFRREMKRLVRQVLLEVFPETRAKLASAEREASPIVRAACEAVAAHTADRQSRFAAMAAEARSIRQRGETADFDALWQKHLPGVPRESAQTKARQFPADISPTSSQPLPPQTLAPQSANGHAPIAAQNP